MFKLAQNMEDELLNIQELLFPAFKSLRSRIDEDLILVKSKDKEKPIKVKGSLDVVKVETFIRWESRSNSWRKDILCKSTLSSKVW